MTWGALLRALLTDPLAWAFAFLVGVLCAVGGYLVGGSVEKDRQEAAANKAVIIAYETIKPKETKSAESINEASKKHEETKQSNNIAAAIVGAEFNGLRVKTVCPSVPTIAASPGEPVKRTGGERPSAVEVDFAGIERKIVELGRDYDNVISQLAQCNAVLAEDRKLCNGQ